MNPTTPPNQSKELITNRFSSQMGSFTAGTLVSRVLGYARDSLVALAFGGGAATDAFYAAFKIPNLLRRFLGEGALISAFVPVFSDVHHKEGKEAANRLLNVLLSSLLVILTVLVGVGVLLAPQVTHVVSWGFTRDPAKFALATDLTRIIFPFLFFICFAAVLSAVLNSCGRFFVPAIAPAGLSIGEILYIIGVAHYFGLSIHGLAASAVAGVAIHMMWQVPSLQQEGYQLRWERPFSDPAVMNVFTLMIPTMLGLCADQVNSFVDQFCASFLQDGAVSALYNSNRVMQLPLALFGIAASSVALPSLSKVFAQGDKEEYNRFISMAVRTSNFVLMPSFVGLAILGVPIIQVLFEHGKFTHEYTQMTYLATVPYAMGLPAYSMSKVFASAFFAQKDTKTPARVAFQSMFINVVLDISLMWTFGVAGLAFATAAAAWYQALALAWLLKKRTPEVRLRPMWASLGRAALLSLLMGSVCYLVSFQAAASLSVFINAPLSIVLGACVYLAGAAAWRLDEWNFYAEWVLKRIRKK